MENQAYNEVIGSPAAPYENELAVGMRSRDELPRVDAPEPAELHRGDLGRTHRGSPTTPRRPSHPLAVASIYSQVKAAGKTWRDYEESAPGNCPLTSSGLYAVKHDPAPYYTGIRSDCANWDVPMGTTTSGNFLADLTNDTLPAFAFVTPNLCNDTHDCSVTVGDNWLQVVVREDPRVAGVRRRPHGRLPHLGRGRRLGVEPHPDDRRQPLHPGGHDVRDELHPLLAAEDDRAAPRDHDVPRPRR